MARLDRLQQTSQDAKAASQAAAAAARKAEHEVLNLQKQNTQLRDRVKDLENKQKVSNILLLYTMVFPLSSVLSACLWNCAKMAAAKVITFVYSPYMRSALIPHAQPSGICGGDWPSEGTGCSPR